jgi:Nuclear pore protein 84 / 107
MGIETYALFLSSILLLQNKLIQAIESEQRRLRQLENAQRYTLDTADIIRHTMKLTLQQTQSEMQELFAEQGQPILAVPLNDPITTLDETQIRAIEWVLLASQEDLTLDCLMNGNILFRRFLRTISPVCKLMNSGWSSQFC